MAKEKVFQLDYDRGGQHALYINNSAIRGIQSIGGTFSTLRQRISHIGQSSQDEFYVPIGELGGRLNLAGVVTSGQQILDFTGESGFNAYIIDNNEASGNYSCISGFLTNYSLSLSPNSLPSFSAQIIASHEIGNIDSGNVDSHILDEIKFTETGAKHVFGGFVGNTAVSISVDDFQTDQIASLDLDISCPRNVIYSLGQNNPQEVKSNYPFEVRASFSLILNDYDISSTQDIPCLNNVSDFGLTLTEYQNTGNSILNLNFSDLSLISEEYSLNNNLSTLNATYVGYFGKALSTDLKPNLPDFNIRPQDYSNTTGCDNVDQIEALREVVQEDEEIFAQCDDDDICDRGICISPTPSTTPSHTPTPTNTITQTPTQTPTPTPTSTITVTPTATPSVGAPPASQSATPTPTTTVSVTPTVSPTSTPTPSSSRPVTLCDNGLAPTDLTVRIEIRQTCGGYLSESSGQNENDTETFTDVLVQLLDSSDAVLQQESIGTISINKLTNVDVAFSICCDQLAKIKVTGKSTCLVNTFNGERSWVSIQEVTQETCEGADPLEGSVITIGFGT